MQSVIQGSGRFSSQAPAQSNAFYLGTLRRNILAAVVGNDLFTDAEQLRCNDSVHQCSNTARLALWLKNVRRVAAEREEANSVALFAAAVERGRELVATAPKYATPEQCDEIFKVASHPCLLACEKSQAIFKIPNLTYSQAIRLLGKLYAKVLHRTGQGVGNDGSTQLTA